MAENSGIGNEALKALIKQMIKEESGGGLTIDAIYPVGSIYMSVNNVSPATFIGGTWTPLDEGRVLIGAGSAHPAGETGGEETHKLSVEEMPGHDHSGDLSGSTGSASVSHKHTRGNMNITGSVIIGSWKDGNTPSGAFSWTTDNENSFGGGGSWDGMKLSFDASRSGAWTGETSSGGGSHSHSLNGASITTSSKGGDTAHNNMQPYLSVYMWQRTA